MTTNELSKFTPDQKRIKIAEACDYRKSDRTAAWCAPHDWPMAKRGSYGVWIEEENLPDYLNDLNAMHGAWESLNVEQEERFCRNLHDVACQRKCSGPVWECGFSLNATASERADAFLLTIL